MVDGCWSKLVHVISWMPQGSVLGPFLFILWTSEFFSILEDKLIGYAQGRLTVNYRYTHRKFQLKFSDLLKDYDLKYAENSKKNLT